MNRTGSSLGLMYVTLLQSRLSIRRVSCGMLASSGFCHAELAAVPTHLTDLVEAFFAVNPRQKSGCHRQNYHRVSTFQGEHNCRHQTNAAEDAETTSAV
jgi:hypothetical protein